MKKTLTQVVCTLGLIVSGNLFAGGTVTKQDVIDIVEKGAAFAKANGKEKALAAFNDKDNKDFFTKGGALYIFAYTDKGVNLALPAKTALNGKNLWDMKDSEGVPFIQDLAKIAKDPGKGWTKWRFHNPALNKVERKLGYVIGMGDWHG